MPEVQHQSKAKRLANLVEAEAEVDILSLPRHQAYAWFPIMTALEAQIRVSFLPELNEETKALIEKERKRLDKAIRPTLISLDKIWPLPSVSVMHVFEIFSDADEVRVYAFGEEVPEGVEGKVGQFTRYKLSKSAAIYGSETMTEARWVSEVAKEWVEVDAEANAGEIATLEERAAVIEFLKDQIEENESYSVRDAIDDLKDEVHLVEPDDEEEEEEEEEDGEEGEETAADKPKGLPAVAASPSTVSTGTAQT
jgi:hypothetical protein